ncbi:MAG: acyl-CoA dehydrogenase family protein [Bacteroidota bacterium]
MKSPYFHEDHHLFRQSVRDFIATEVRPYIDEWEEQKQIPRSLWKKMGDMGYLGICHEEAYGGMEADFFFSVVFLEELAGSGSGGFSAAISVHEYMATNHLAKAGSEELKQAFLAPAIAGEMIAALGISEPAVGSNVAGIQTTARKEGEVYLVNGGKNFITNGVYADFIVTAVKTEKGVSLLLIEGDSEGVSRTKLKKMGWHSSDTAEIGFSDVRVPVSHLIGEEGQGFKYIMDSFQLERLAGSCMSVGGMESALRTTLGYMEEREAFGHPINKYQALRHRIADLATEIESCKQFVHHTAWLHEQGEYVVKQCSMAKLLSSELSNKVMDRCLQMFGGYGYMEEYPMARAFRDSRVGTIAGGTSEIMKEIIAKMVIDDVNYDVAYRRGSPAGSPSPAGTPQEAHHSNHEAPNITAKQIVHSLSNRFKADKANGYQTTIHYDISGPGGGQFTIQIAAGHCEVREGLHGPPSCTITVSDEVYTQLELGKMDAQSAFMQGLIQISNIAEAMTFAKFFKRIQI